MPVAGVHLQALYPWPSCGRWESPTTTRPWLAWRSPCWRRNRVPEDRPGRPCPWPWSSQRPRCRCRFRCWPTIARPRNEASLAAAKEPPPGRSPRGNTPAGVQRTASKPVPLPRTPTTTLPLPATPWAALKTPPKLTPPRPWKLSSAHAAVENSSAPAITTDFACIVASIVLDPIPPAWRPGIRSVELSNRYATRRDVTCKASEHRRRPKGRIGGRHLRGAYSLTRSVMHPSGTDIHETVG